MNPSDLTSALRSREEPRAQLEGATENVTRARTTVASARAQLEKAQADAASCDERYTSRLHAWTVSGGSGPPPVHVSDVGVLTSRATAEATLRGATASLSRCEADEQAARSALIAAERAVHQCKHAAHRARAEGLLARLDQLERERVEVRSELAATAVAPELYGVRADYCGVLTALEIERLNSPRAAEPSLAEIFSPTRGAVVGDANIALSGTPELLHEYLRTWRELDDALERGA